jgi:type II secretory pathway component PulJ
MHLTDEQRRRIENKEISMAGLAREIGCAKSTVQKAMGRHPDARRKARKKSSCRTGIGVGIAEFMRANDPVAKMRATLEEAKALVEDNHGRLIKNHELRKAVHCSDPKLWADLARDPDEGVTNMQFMWGDEWYWSTPDMVQEICSNHRQARPIVEG